MPIEIQDKPVIFLAEKIVTDQLPVLNYISFTHCTTIAELETAYANKGYFFSSKENLLKQIEIDWAKVHIIAAQYYTDREEGLLEPTIIEISEKRIRNNFGLRHCVDSDVPDFTDKLEEYILNVSSAPVYVEQSIGQQLKLNVPYTECVDWIVMSSAERFCYGIAMAHVQLEGRKILAPTITCSAETAVIVKKLSAVALEHLSEPSALKSAHCKSKGVPLLEKLIQCQGVFSPLLYSSSPFGT